MLGVVSIWLLGGCAFSDGEPWGEVRFALTAALDESGRAVDGGYETSNDYVVRVESFEIEFQDVSVSAASAAAADFDPADPPAGYSLCHNGHCHSDDGQLVDYDEIAIELAGASSEGGTTLQAIATVVALSEEELALPLGVCSNACRLERVRLGLVSLRATGVSLRLHVTDRRLGDAQRIPDEGVTIELSSDDLLEWSSPLSERVDGRADPLIELAVDFRVPVTVFDGLDWSADEAPPELFTNLLDDAALEVHVVRHPH